MHRKKNREIIMNETTIKKPNPQFAQDILKQLMTIDRSRNPEELNDAILTLLHLIGRYSDAERVYLFDKLNYDPQNLPSELLYEDANPEIYSNTFEWCADGTPSKMDALKYVPAFYIADWLDIFQTKHPVLIENIENVKDTMPVEYEYLKRAHVHAAFIMPIFIIQNFMASLVLIILITHFPIFLSSRLRLSVRT